MISNTDNAIYQSAFTIRSQCLCILVLILFVWLFSGCNTINHAVYGTYYLQNDKTTTLSLKEDSSFVYKSSREDSFFVSTGIFYAVAKGIELHTLAPANNAKFSDSVSFFTGITSFSFRDADGNSIDIRRIRINDAPSKAHYGNSLYYFEQDFKATDTIRFFFQGYGLLRYPGDIKKISGNNAHHITLYPYPLPALFRHTLFTGRNNKWQCPSLGQSWRKKNR